MNRIKMITPDPALVSVTQLDVVLSEDDTHRLLVCLILSLFHSTSCEENKKKDRDRKIIRRKKILVKLRIQYSFEFRSRETVFLVQQNQRRESFLPINPDVRLGVYVTYKKVNDPLPEKKTVIHLYPRHTREKKRKLRRSEWESSIERERERVICSGRKITPSTFSFLFE